MPNTPQNVTDPPLDYRCLLDAPKRAMTSDEATIFNLMMESPDDKIDLVFDDLKSRAPMVTVLHNRIPEGVDISKQVQVFCGTLSSKPAVAVMWAFSLSLAYWETGKRVTIDTFSTDLFPWGIPRDKGDGLKDIWTKQYIPAGCTTEGSNYLDSPAYWEQVKAHALGTKEGATA